MSEFKAVKVTKGNGGWGSGLVLKPTDAQNIVLSVTGGGIHPVAAKIAELTGATAVDGFINNIPDAQVLVAVINCSGTARIGVYPRSASRPWTSTPVSPAVRWLSSSRTTSSSPRWVRSR